MVIKLQRPPPGGGRPMKLRPETAARRRTAAGRGRPEGWARFRVRSRVYGFGVEGSGFGVKDLGSRIWG